MYEHPSTAETFKTIK
jgi:hypothetical protein